MLMSAPSSSVLSVKNLNVMISSASRKVNILIMCKLMILIIRELSRISTFLLRLLVMFVDELVKSSTPTLDGTHVHEESISDVQDVLVESSTPIPDDTDVSEAILVILCIY